MSKVPDVYQVLLMADSGFFWPPMLESKVLFGIPSPRGSN